MNTPDPILMRRFGRFKLPIAAPADHMRAVTACLVIVVRCEHLFAEGVLEYTAISPLFATVPLGDIVPDYDWILTVNEPLGQISARPVRQEIARYKGFAFPQPERAQ